MIVAYLIEFALALFWIFDVINLPFMEMFDTTYPINTVAWILIWLSVPTYKITRKKKERND